MKGKIISLFTLLAFVIFSLSCYTTSTKEVRTVVDWKGKKVKILAVDKTSGEHIEFSKDGLGRIYYDSIKGTAIILNKDVEIDRANIESLEKDRITTKDGKIYRVVTGTARAGKDKIIFSYESSESISIPLSEVKSVRVKRLDPFQTFLAVVACSAPVVIAIWVAVVLGQES